MIPSKVTGTLDLRTLLSRDKVQELLDDWRKGNIQDFVHYETIQEPVYAKPLGPFGQPFKPPAQLWDHTIEPVLKRHFSSVIWDDVFPGGTDARFVRAREQPPLLVIGMSPFAGTMPRLHDRDEYLPVQEFARAISVYADLFASLLLKE